MAGEEELRFLCASCPEVQCRGLVWPLVPPTALFPPSAPSAARHCPPTVPRALYQIINKSAGAVHVNILAGLAGHCRGAACKGLRVAVEG